MGTACTRYETELSAIADGQVEASLKVEFEEHVAKCSDCQEQFKSMTSLGTLLSQAMNPEKLEVPDIWAMMQDKLPSLCEVMQEDLSAYLDGELTPAAQEGVKDHLKDCENCMSDFKKLNATNGLLAKGLELPESVSVDIWTAVKARLNEDCALISTELSAFVDQQVPQARHTAITAHLFDCTNCRTQFDAMTRVGELIRDAYQPDFPENFDLWPSIKSKLQVVQFIPKVQSATQEAQTKQKPLARRLYLIGAAAAIVGIIGSVAVWLTMPMESGLTPVSSEAYLLESSMPGSAQPAAEEVVYYED